MTLLSITSVMRVGYPKLLKFGHSGGLCKLQLPQLNHVTSQVAFITGKAMRADRPPRPPPFDYKNKKYNFWHAFTDPMEKRLDDNSRIVVVEGLPGVGKDKFARALADELEMYYMPQPKFDDIFINAYNFDCRSLNDQLPIDAQYFDDKMFLSDPHNRNTLVMQHTFYLMRYAQYMEALTHVFSTGDGVVLQRSPWSDSTFMKAIYDAGYISELGYDHYKCTLAASLHHLLRPHLVIYLDIPSSVAMQRIQKRGLPHEVNSKVLTTEYLDSIAKNYKDFHLPDISKHAHVLVYNCIEEPDMPAIVYDIEKLKFEDYERENTKMCDWNFTTWDLRRGARSTYANDKLELFNSALVARFDVPEMLISAQDQHKQYDVERPLREKYVGFRYAEGYDPAADKNVLWKT